MAIHFILIVGRDDSVENYKNAVISAGYIPVITDSLEMLKKSRQCHDALCACLLSRIDLLLLPGGGDISPDLLHTKDKGSRNIDRNLDLIQFSYLDYFLSKQKPILGVCKGMQMINIRLGGTLIQDMTSKQNQIHAYLNGKDNRHSCTYTDSEMFHTFPNASKLRYLYRTSFLPLQINSAHHQCVDDVPPELFVFQYAKDGIPEGFIHKSLPIIGLQWHPERLFYSEGSYLKLFLNCLLT